jgi:hexosaminidase
MEIMKIKHITICCCLFVLANGSMRAQNVTRADYQIIPAPKSVKVDTTKCFTLKDGMTIVYDAENVEAARIANFLSQWVEQQTGVKLVPTTNRKNAAIQLSINVPQGKKNKKAITNQQQEAYSITVSRKGVDIRAYQPAGLFRAAQTLRKSISTSALSLPYALITDEPRFEYRGVHLDCSRHFFSTDFIKQYLDVLALHGCNQFHWHLTDNQGWRFEVKAIPELAIKGSVRKESMIGRNSGIYDGTPYGGYYTQEECRELVRYAAERYINIVPEIDLPGHAQAALHALPQLGCTGGPYPVVTHWGGSHEILCAGNPETMKFLKTVMSELCDVFPSKYIHIGGDECPKDRWRTCAKCQAKIKELGLKPDGKHSVENQLQTWMNHEIESFLAERGRNIIGWDEVLEGGLTEGGIVMSWRGIEGGIEAAKQHHQVIMTPTSACYFDYYQLKDRDRQPVAIGNYLPLSKVYYYEPLAPDALSEEEQKYILGAQANLWTEYVGYPQHVYYMLLPRLDAISEVQWCRPDQKDFKNFKQRLPKMKRLYDKLEINYCRQEE